MKCFLEDRKYRKSVLKTTFPVAVLLGLAICFGAYLERNGELDFSAWRMYLEWVLLTAAAEPALIALWLGLDVCGGRSCKNNECFPCRKSHWAAVYLLFVFCYTITFLAVFPGFFAYDATMAHGQVWSGEIISQHPWIHTLLLGYMCEFAISHLGHANVGIALYIYFQMLFVAGCFTYAVYCVKRKAGHGAAVVISILFYAFFPTIHMFALCSTKDTMFTAVMLVLLFLLLEMSEDAGRFLASKWKSAALFLAMFGFLVLRKNAPYAMLAFLPVFLLFFKGNRWRGGLLAAAALGLFWIYDVPVARAVGVQDIGPKEALSVPSQQLARVYNVDKSLLSPEEAALIETFYPKEFLDRYLPKLADYSKGVLNTEYFVTHTGEYVRLWLRLGLRAPDTYMNAFLVNQYGFWYPWASLDGYRGYDGMKDTALEDAEVYYFAYVTEEPGERWSLIPWLDAFYFRLSTLNLHRRLPGLSLLFSPGFLFWVFAAAGAYSVHRKRREYYLAFVLCGMVWLTVLLGPIALVRYVLFLFFGLPYALCAMLERRNANA